MNEYESNRLLAGRLVSRISHEAQTKIANMIRAATPDTDWSAHNDFEICQLFIHGGLMEESETIVAGWLRKFAEASEEILQESAESFKMEKRL